MSGTQPFAPPTVAGLSLAGRSVYVINPEQNRAVCESLGAVPPEDGSAHPIFFFIATQVGMGLSVVELCAICEFDVRDGPMMASSHVDFARPLMTATEYRVQGEIRSLTRKSSRKFGVMDLLDFELRLVGADGEPVLSCTHVWVLPRRVNA